MHAYRLWIHAAFCWLGASLLVEPASAQEKVPPPPRLDAAGDPLPPYAVARFGTHRWRQSYSVRQMACSADGSIVVAGSDNDGLIVWDAKTGTRRNQAALTGLKSNNHYSGHFVLSGDGSILADQHQRPKTFNEPEGAGFIQVFETKTLKELRTISVGPFNDMVLSHDGALVATVHWPKDAGKPFLVKIWARDTGKIVQELATSGPAQLYGAVAFVAFGHDGKTLIVGDSRRIRMWDVASGKETRRLDCPARFIRVSRDGRVLAALGERAVHLWNLDKGEEIRTLPVDPPGEQRWWKIELAADGNVVVFAGADLLQAWDVVTGRELFSWKVTVASLGLSPDGKTIYTGHEYYPTIRRWDLTTGREVELCPGHHGAVDSLDFSPDGKTLAHVQCKFTYFRYP